MNSLNQHIAKLNETIDDLTMENKDLIVNGQLEDIQTNLNDYMHNQKIEKKEETFAKQMTMKDQEYKEGIAKLEEEKLRLEQTVEADKIKLKE